MPPCGGAHASCGRRPGGGSRTSETGGSAWETEGESSSQARFSRGRISQRDQAAQPARGTGTMQPGEPRSSRQPPFLNTRLAVAVPKSTWDGHQGWSVVKLAYTQRKVKKKIISSTVVTTRPHAGPLSTPQSMRMMMVKAVVSVRPHEMAARVSSCLNPTCGQAAAQSAAAATSRNTLHAGGCASHPQQ